MTEPSQPSSTPRDPRPADATRADALAQLASLRGQAERLLSELDPKVVQAAARKRASKRKAPRPERKLRLSRLAQDAVGVVWAARGLPVTTNEVAEILGRDPRDTYTSLLDGSFLAVVQLVDVDTWVACEGAPYGQAEEGR